MVRKFTLSHRFRQLITSIIAALLLAACNLPRATPELPSQTPFPTDTVTPPVSTPSPTPLVPLPSNPTPTNTTASGGGGGGGPTGAPINLLFATGTTALVQSGTLQPNQSQDYTINVGNAQPMILILNSTNSGAVLGIYDAAGNVVLDPTKKWNRWQALLSQNVQLYKIRVLETGTSAEDFNLTVKVAARINFPAGSTTASIPASTAKGYVLSYAARGTAGQTLNASLDVPAGRAIMDIFGLATGESLLGAGEKLTAFNGSLPATQDYIIEIFPTHGDVVNFTLIVTIK